jgi:hypothetical protein
MKQSEAHRAEREAREDMAAHGGAKTRHTGPLNRYLSAIGYDHVKRAGEDKAPVESGATESARPAP